MLASRSQKKQAGEPATVRFQALPLGKREAKFAALAKLALGGKAWTECPTDWRAPFLPASTGAWATFPKLEELFDWNGAGVQAKRTWVMAPDAQSLIERWNRLISAPTEEKETLFHATLRDGKPADRHIRSIVRESLPGYLPNLTPIIEEKAPCAQPVPYGFRSFNRHWIIPDNRLITQPNAELWRSRSERQIYLTAFTEESPTAGPSLTFTGLVPDLHHYKGSFGGRVFPLWRDPAASVPNLRPKLLAFLGTRYGIAVSAEDLLAYIAAIAAHPAFTARFQNDLSTPGLRIPITADAGLFADAAALGREVIWLHTFGERFADAAAGRPLEPPRLPAGQRPQISAAGAIPGDPESMPDTLDYDATQQRLLVGRGWIDLVSPAVWNYEVSGKQVLVQWFSYRKKSRERPIIGDRRPPSPLGNIQPDHWLPEYTTELLNVLNVLGRLTALEPAQAALLEKVCAAPLLAEETLRAAGAFESSAISRRAQSDDNQVELSLS